MEKYTIIEGINKFDATLSYTVYINGFADEDGIICPEKRVREFTTESEAQQHVAKLVMLEKILNNK